MAFAGLMAAAAPALASSSAATGGPQPACASASIDFAVRIPPVLSLTTLEARTVVDVPPTREGGAVEVADAASFEIRSNLPAYGLRFEITDPEVVAVEVRGLGEALTVTAEGAIVRFAATSKHGRTLRRTLAYRLLFRDGARPGPRPMPVAYSVLGE